MKKSKVMDVLHENDFGRIAKCKCCSEIQVQLGNVIFILSEEEYLDFSSFFEKIALDFEIKKHIDKSSQQYLVKTYVHDLILSFKRKELEKTIELIRFSDCMLSVKKIFRTHES